MIVSYSKIKRWRFCRQAYYFNYVERIVPKKKPKPLKLGSIIHAMLEAITREEDWTKILAEVKREYSKMMEEEKDYYGNLPEDSSRIIKGYLSRWSKENITYSLVEENLGPIPLAKDINFEMRADRLATDGSTGLTFLCETKTGRKIPQEDIRIWDLQTVLYAWGLREVGYEIEGIIWDYIRTKAPAIPQVLKNGELSRRADIDTTYGTYLKAIKDNRLDVGDYKDFLDNLKGRRNNFYKRIKIPLTEGMIEPLVNDARQTALEISYLEHIPVKNISGFTCPRCQYHSLCYAQLRQLDEDFIRKAEFMKKEDEIEYGIEEEEDSD